MKDLEGIPDRTMDLCGARSGAASDSRIASFLRGVVGVVEANSFEQHMLWDENRRRAVPMTWKSSMSGYGEVIGHYAKMPVCVSLFVSEVDGQRLLFMHATSQVVDHRKIDKWLRKTLPRTAFRADGYPNRVDAMNFHNVFRSAVARERTRHSSPLLTAEEGPGYKPPTSS